MKNAICYAYMGDTVYETYVRKYLLSLDIAKVKDLQKQSLNFVSAKSQRRIVEDLIARNLLNEDELAIYKWGRNAKGGKSKATDIVTYRIATGFECLIGYLYLNNKEERINEIMHFILK
jgi:ribonuclease III family protein